MEAGKIADDDQSIFKVPKLPAPVRRPFPPGPKSALQVEKRILPSVPEFGQQPSQGPSLRGTKRNSSVLWDCAAETAKRPSAGGRFQDCLSFRAVQDSDERGGQDLLPAMSPDSTDDAQGAGRRPAGVSYGFGKLHQTAKLMEGTHLQEVNPQQRTHLQEGNPQQRELVQEGNLQQRTYLHEGNPEQRKHVQEGNYHQRTQLKVGNPQQRMQVKEDFLQQKQQLKERNIRQRAHLKEDIFQQRKQMKDGSVVTVFEFFEQQETFYAHCNICDIYTRDYRPERLNFYAHARGRGHSERLKLAEPVKKKAPPAWWDVSLTKRTFPQSGYNEESSGEDGGSEFRGVKRMEATAGTVAGLLPGMIPGSSAEAWGLDTHCGQNKRKNDAVSSKGGLLPGVIPSSSGNLQDCHTRPSSKVPALAPQQVLLPGVIPGGSSEARKTGLHWADSHRQDIASAPEGGLLRRTTVGMALDAAGAGTQPLDHHRRDAVHAQGGLLPGVIPGTSLDGSSGSLQRECYAQRGWPTAPDGLLPGTIPKVTSHGGDYRQNSATGQGGLFPPKLPRFPACDPQPVKHDKQVDESIIPRSLVPGTLPEVPPSNDRDTAAAQQTKSQMQHKATVAKCSFLPGQDAAFSLQAGSEGERGLVAPPGQLLPGVVPTLKSPSTEEKKEDHTLEKTTGDKRHLLPGVIPKLRIDNDGEAEHVQHQKNDRHKKRPRPERNLLPGVVPALIPESPKNTAEPRERGSRRHDKTPPVERDHSRGDKRKKMDSVQDEAYSQERVNDRWDRVDRKVVRKKPAIADRHWSGPGRQPDTTREERRQHAWDPEEQYLSKLAALKDWPSHMPARRKLLAPHDIREDQHGAHFEVAAVQPEVASACRASEISRVLLDIHKSSLDVAKVNLHALQEYSEMRQPVDLHSEVGRAHAFLKSRGYQVLQEDNLSEIIQFMWDTQDLLSFLSHDLGSARRKIYTELSPDDKDILTKEKMTHEWLFGGNVLRKLDELRQERMPWDEWPSHVIRPPRSGGRDYKKR